MKSTNKKEDETNSNSKSKSNSNHAHNSNPKTKSTNQKYDYTTIPVHSKTKRKLDRFKLTKEQKYDTLLNMILNNTTIEEIHKRHYERQILKKSKSPNKSNTM